MPRIQNALWASIAIFSLASAALTSCSQSDMRDIRATNRPIFYGTEDHVHTASVALTSGGTLVCSGDMITDSVVLTAAHCLEDYWGNPVDPTSFQIFFGQDIAGSGETRNVSEGMQHPDWDRNSMTGDIALLRLSAVAPATVTPIPHLPASLGLTSADEGVSSVDFSGYGLTENNSDSERLHVSDVIDVVCLSPSGCGNAVNKSFMYDQTPGGPCSGDSGGPAYILRSGTEYVAGVTSYGDYDCDVYGVSTTVDQYEGWINSFIAGGGTEDCTNGSDDDGDNLADCLDSDCAQHPSCLGPSACVNAANISCDDSISGTTVGGAYNFVDYDCGGQVSETGPEVAFLVNAPAGSQVEANLTLGGGGDLDLFLLPVAGNDCNQNNCLDVSGQGGNDPEYLSFTVPSGGVYLVVDTWDDATSFTLSLTCNGMDEDCTNGSDDDGDNLADCLDSDCAQHPSCLPSSACDQAASLSCGDSLSDDTANGVSIFTDYSCLSGFTEDGNEIAYVISAAAGTDITLDMVPGGSGDLDIFLLGSAVGSCDPGDCLFKSTYVGNDAAEQILFTMGSDPVYLIVETYDTTSSYDLSMTCAGTFEDCTNNVDDDGDGQTDCADSDCASHQNCQTTPEDCTNNVDDDGDGQTDCADSDCANHQACQTTPEDCTNNVDDDGDGQTDCADSDCANHQACQTTPEDCTNNVDDDGDGQTDCADSDCANHQACQTTQENCTNNLDDDGDGQTDCDDSDCANHQACQTTQENCTNNLDDDGDGQTDCDDSDCASHQACQTTQENCTNNLDDDGDGQTDCDDSDCVNHQACQTGQEDCTNGIDDDGDNAVDCADTDCANHANCQTGQEDCTNGLDDDNDNAVDCADSDCANHSACQTGQEDCTNGIDDDGDFTIDCADTDCANDPACQATQEDCQNGLDDDGDQLADCSDPDCASHAACQPGAENCTNGLDDDSDGATDCADSDCASHATCIPTDDDKSSGCGCGTTDSSGLPGGLFLFGLGLLFIRRRMR